MSARPAHPFRWPLSIDAVWLAMPIFVVVVRTFLQPIPMEDYWWHLVFGRLMDASGSIPDSNLYLYTLPANTPFYDQAWLAQWLMYKIAAGGGHVATVFAHVALLATAWIVLVMGAFRRGASPVVVGIAAAFAHYISASTLMPRTQMFAYVPFVVVVGAVTVFGSRERFRHADGYLALLVILTTAFWANTHGTFVLAPALVVGAAGGWVLEQRRRGRALSRSSLLFWGGLTLGTAVATAASPGGIQNLLYPLTILSATKSQASTVLEWAPPGLYFQGLLFYGALAGSVVVLFRRRAAVPLTELAIFAMVTVIAISSVRGVLWWAIVAVLVVGPQITAMRGGARERAPRAAEGVLNLGILAALLVGAASAMPGGPLFRAMDPAEIFGDGRLGTDGDAAVLAASHPAGLIERLRAEPGRVFHDQSAGGFLEWMLTDPGVPRPVAFIDQRLEIVPPELWEEYFVISRARGDWEATARKYGVEVFLLNRGEQDPLIAALDASSAYALVGEDRTWRLYVTSRRSDSPPVPAAHPQ